jgi:hypothetical protein
MPAFKLRGKTIAGFAAFKNHLSYLPSQRIGDPEAGEGDEGRHIDERVAAFPDRSAAAEGPRQEAPRRPYAAGVRRAVGGNVANYDRKWWLPRSSSDICIDATLSS